MQGTGTHSPPPLQPSPPEGSLGAQGVAGDDVDQEPSPLGPDSRDRGSQAAGFRALPGSVVLPVRSPAPFAGLGLRSLSGTRCLGRSCLLWGKSLPGGGYSANSRSTQKEL